MESARDKIHTTVLSHIAAQADVIAPQIAEHTARHWANQVIHEMTGSIPGSYSAPQLPASKIIDADKSDIVYANTEAASRPQTIDPHGVQKRIDTEPKNLPKKPLRERVKEVFKPSTSEVSPQAPTTTVVQTDERLVTEESSIEPETIDNGPSHDDPSQWTMADWRQYRNEVDAWTFDAKWTEVWGDHRFPDDRSAPKKRNGGKKSGNVTRREVLGMESQDD